MDKSQIKLIGFDLDGTLTQHKTKLDEAHRKTLDRLREHYRLLMIGAGSCSRIWNQMEQYPIDIIGNYGMQCVLFKNGGLDFLYNESHPLLPREVTEARITSLRGKYGYTVFSGGNTEFHDSGCITFPILGTLAKSEDKLSFDPDRKKRRRMYDDVCSVFPEYNVFVGGSSSFDFAPKPFDKKYALSDFCRRYGFSPAEVVYFGDDYGPGGNDESLYRSDFQFVRIDDYTSFPEIASSLLL